MAHSDLTLERFLDRILQSDLAKGIKLDFKEMDVVEPALVIIQSRRPDVPLWLNADIIAGPVNALSEPLDAQLFLGLCRRYFPDAVLSVGWTTPSDRTSPTSN